MFKSLGSSSLLTAAIVIPLFYNLWPFKFIYNPPGEVIPYASLIFPLLFCLPFFRKSLFSLIGFLTLLFFTTLYLVLSFFSFNGIPNILGLFNPILYYILIFTCFSNQILPLSLFNNFLLNSCRIMLLFMAINSLFPQLYSFLRSFVVLDIAGRDVMFNLSRSGPSGLFSEPSYQSLIAVGIFAFFISSPKFDPVKLLYPLLIILFSRSLTGYILALAYFLINLFLFRFGTLIPFIIDRLRLTRYVTYSRLTKILLLFSSLGFLFSFLYGYSRFHDLVTLFSEIDIFSFPDLSEIESYFGSTRLFRENSTNSSLWSSLLVLFQFPQYSLLNLDPNLSTCWSQFFCFSTLVGLPFLFILFFPFVLHIFSQILPAVRSSKQFILPTVVTLFSVFILAPNSNPLCYLPLLHITCLNSASDNSYI